MAGDDGLRQRQRLCFPKREAEREKAPFTIYHGAKVFEAGRYQGWCDWGRLEGTLRLSQFSTFACDFACEAESGSKDRPRDTASRGLWHDHGSLCAVRHGVDARCSGQVPGAARGRQDSPTHGPSSVRIVGGIMGGRFRLSADKCFEMMVARDGIEPPTPAFSGLDSATVILLIRHWLALYVAPVSVRFIGTIMEPKKFGLPDSPHFQFTAILREYMSIGVRTAQRYEALYRMPVHRPAVKRPQRINWRFPMSSTCR